jgi:hypothetical protein
MTSSGYPFNIIKYGFRWGPVTVKRTISDPKLGVVLTVKSEGGERVEIRVTPAGQKMEVSHIMFGGGTYPDAE